MQVFHLSMFKGKLGELLGADLRSLAALRVAMAVLIIVDLLLRSRDLVPHYTDTGALPRIAVLDQTTSRWLISLHLINGTWEMQAILFVLAGLSLLHCSWATKRRLLQSCPGFCSPHWTHVISLFWMAETRCCGCYFFGPFFCRGDLVGRLIVL
jgi:hypothetical protein